MGERRPDDLANAEFGAARKNLIFRIRPKQGILRLTRHKPDDAGHFYRRFYLVERPFAEAHIARLALTNCLGQSRHRFLKWSFLVKAVALIEIDIVRPKPLQRSVELLDNLRAGQPSVGVAHRAKDFRRQEVGVARNSRERLTKHTLGGAAAIDIRGIKKIDPKVECLVDASHRLALLNASRSGQPGAE